MCGFQNRNVSFCGHTYRYPKWKMKTITIYTQYLGELFLFHSEVGHGMLDNSSSGEAK